MAWPHTVTIWNRSDGETYARKVVRGALWEDNRGAQLRKTGESADNGIFVMLPLVEGLTIRPDDFMAKGEVAGEVKSARNLLALGAVRVSAADRFDVGRLRHWEVTCK